jgi:selenide, water dikinase
MSNPEGIRLTQTSSKAGCGCKIGPADLADVLRHLPAQLHNRNVLVGLDTPDDAGVYRLSDELAIVQTVDFFTPIVDDPYSFGQIAAANALSDVYAMGGRPITVLNIVGFPIGKLPAEILAEILRGGMEKVTEAGAVTLGGHSIDDPEPKFGMAVTGVIHPDQIAAKAGARNGDLLVLTKPIGVGVVSTAIKQGLASRDEELAAIRVMSALNDVATHFKDLDIRGMTDITGFGLLGHVSEIARQSKVGISIRSREVPVLEAAWKYGRQGTWPGGTRKNRAWLSDKVQFDEGIDEVTQYMLCDAMTSGGLLIAVSEARLQALLRILEEHQTLAAAVIGGCTAAHPGIVKVTV